MAAPDAPAGSGEPPLPRRRYAILVGILVAVVVVVAPFVTGSGAIFHEACVRGSTVSRAELWTPLILLNAPFDGWARGSASGSIFPGYSVATTTSNGSADGFFVLSEWTVFRQSTSDVLGPGSATSCHGPYGTAVQGLPPGEQGTLTLPLNVSEASAQSADVTSVTLNGFSSVLFNVSYAPDPAAGGVGTCGAGGSNLSSSISSSAIAVSVPIELNGEVEGYLPSIVPAAATYSFTFPSAGNWFFDDHVSVGVAFDFESCPSGSGPAGGWTGPAT